MKRLTLILIGLVYSISCFAQKIALNDTVSINLPKATETLTRDRFSASVTEKFNYSRIAVEHVPNKNERTDNKHFYEVGDILIKLTHGKRRLKDKDNYLSETKKGLDAAFNLGGNTNKYTSVIKSINGNSVLITYHEIEDVGYYEFFCNDTTNTLALNGALQFKLSDKDKATKILNDLLVSIEFTK
jgi:hypothetical protein